MHLTLVPPSSCPLPLILQSHSLPPPLSSTSLQPHHLKTPALYLRTRRQLAQLGLPLVDALAVDRSAWWMFAVTEVRWDLEEEEVVVVLADGTEERWELEGEAGKSSEWVEESGEDELAGDGEKAGKSRGRQDKNPTTARPSRWAPSTVSATLHDFSVRLRSAYEDLGTSSAQHPSAPTIDSENDYRQLMRLSADPTREIPFECSDKKTMYEYAMESAAEDEEEEEEVERESQGKGGGPSQDVSDKDKVPLEDPHRFHGQFRSRRRPQRLPPLPTIGDEPPPPNQPDDYLSLIVLLTSVRTYLASLFSATIIPKLKDRLPPTYALWSVDGAIVWCRHLALQKSAEAADLILELLDDDGDVDVDVDGSSDRDELSEGAEPDIAVFDSDSSSLGGGGGGEYGQYDDEGGITISDFTSTGGGRGYGSSDGRFQWRLEEKRQKRIDDNPLAALKDDYQLRCWCEEAGERWREVKRDEEWTARPSKPAWVKPVVTWEVSRAVRGDSDLDELFPYSTKSSRPSLTRRGQFALPSSLQPKSLTAAAAPPTSPPGSDTDDDDSPSSSGRLSLPGLVVSSPSSSSSSSSSDSDSTSPASPPASYSLSLSRLSASGRRSPELFYCEDLVGEQFLPRRLPRDLVCYRRERGREMERLRKGLHEKLNQVAGLQKKIYQLQEYVDEELLKFDEGKESERAEKDPTPTLPSSLRHPGPSSTSLPPLTPLKSDLPLKAQPLRFQTADKNLTLSLKKALHRIEPSVKARQTRLKRIRDKKDAEGELGELKKEAESFEGKETAMVRVKTKVKVKAKGKGKEGSEEDEEDKPRSKSPAPRKRQKLNLDVYGDVVALSTEEMMKPKQVPWSDSGQEQRPNKVKRTATKLRVGMEGKRTKRKRSIEYATAAAEGADDEGPPRKEPRRTMRSSDIYVDPSSLSSPTPSSASFSTAPFLLPSSAASSSPLLDSRHHAVLELSNSRRAGLEELVVPSPSSPSSSSAVDEPPSSLDWNDESDAHVPWSSPSAAAFAEEDDSSGDEEMTDDEEDYGDEEEMELDEGDESEDSVFADLDDDDLLVEEDEEDLLEEDDEGDFGVDVEPSGGNNTWGSLPLLQQARTPSPAALEEAKKHPNLLLRAPSSFPKSFDSSSSPATSSSTVVSVAPAFPVSSERGGREQGTLPLAVSSLRPVSTVPPNASTSASASTTTGVAPAYPSQSHSSPAFPHNLCSPRPLRPFSSSPDLSAGVTLSLTPPSPSPSPSSSHSTILQAPTPRSLLPPPSSSPLRPASEGNASGSSASLAQRLRESLGVSEALMGGFEASVAVIEGEEVEGDGEDPSEMGEGGC